jgi:hypothetical protein
VLPGPRVSIASHFLALLHPAVAHRAPLSPGPTYQPLRPRRSRPPLPLFTVRPPLSEWSRAAAPVSCRLTRCHTSAPPSPLLLPPPRGTEPDPPALFLPARAAIKWRRPTSSLVSPVFLLSAPVHRASSPTSFPSTPLSTDDDREASGRAGPRWFPPELLRRPPSSVSVAWSFDLSQPTAPTHCPPPPSCRARHGCRRPPCQLHHRRTPSIELDSATPPSRHLPGEPSPPSCCPAGSS